MNFFSALKKIVPVITGIEHFAAPIVSGLYPPAAPAIAALDNIVSRIQNAMISVEAQIPADGQGAVKSAMVVQDFQAYLTDLKSSLGLVGKTIQYDDVELKAGIASQADAYNHFAKVKASIKIV